MDRQMAKKVIVIFGILLVIAGFHYLGLARYFTLSYIKGAQKDLQALYAKNSIAVIGLYMGIYILITALSLPGAAVITLAGGAVFGLAAGAVAVSFASTIGATLACMASRFLFRDWVEKRFSDRLKTINQGIEREGAFYLFTLRLIPVFPFFVINLVMGITQMPLFTFFWVSQAGMLAGTIVYVNAGMELGRIDSVADILSPKLIVSFVILGIFPIAAKRLLSFYNAKKAGM